MKRSASASVSFVIGALLRCHLVVIVAILLSPLLEAIVRMRDSSLVGNATPPIHKFSRNRCCPRLSTVARNATEISRFVASGSTVLPELNRCRLILSSIPRGLAVLIRPRKQPFTPQFAAFLDED